VNQAPAEAERRVALVMASSRGLGAASAESLAVSGHDLVLVSRDEQTLAATADRIRQHGGRVVTVVSDVSDESSSAAVMARAQEEFGHVDVLVANAGGPPPGAFSDCSDDLWVTAFELTLMSAVRAIRATLPAMIARGFGRIVVIGSSSVVAPIPNLTLSNAFRPALAGLVTSLAFEVAQAGVTVNLVAPGRFDTDRVHELDQGRATKAGKDYTAFRSMAEAAIPARRYGVPKEVGGLVAFLASDAAAYLTGQSLLIDGGLVPRLP